ncbi:hypothetical protein BaRGS_00031061 [Batillaria attramentaria]|uniref:Uncharacterized protein n=1 Tax=Batillaria attramentaria TaxID=370345 RepID=A0ABD0JSW2_9CAEN
MTSSVLWATASVQSERSDHSYQGHSFGFNLQSPSDASAFAKHRWQTEIQQRCKETRKGPAAYTPRSPPPNPNSKPHHRNHLNGNEQVACLRSTRHKEAAIPDFTQALTSPAGKSSE